MFDDILKEQKTEKSLYEKWQENVDLLKQCREEILDLQSKNIVYKDVADRALKGILDFIANHKDRDIEKDFPDIADELQEILENEKDT